MSGSLQKGNEKESGLLLHRGYKIKRWEQVSLCGNNFIIFVVYEVTRVLRGV